MKEREARKNLMSIVVVVVGGINPQIKKLSHPSLMDIKNIFACDALTKFFILRARGWKNLQIIFLLPK